MSINQIQAVMSHIDFLALQRAIETGQSILIIDSSTADRIVISGDIALMLASYNPGPHGNCSRCGAALARVEARDRSHVCEQSPVAPAYPMSFQTPPGGRHR